MKIHFPNSIAEINLNGIIQNIEQLRSRNPEQKLLVVVKSDAYGHGAVRVSKHIEEKTDWFGVASVDEGIELRMGGIKKPILVFGIPSAQNAAAYVTHNLTATISDKTHFSMLMDGTSYHLNFDTGMKRLGLDPSEAEEVRRLAVANQRLICSGIYSHYATADDPDSEFVYEQNRRFKELLKNFAEVELVHMSNTGATAFYAIDHFSMIRTGLIPLGYTAGKTEVDWLNPVLSWKSKLVQVRRINRGEGVSYDHTWKAPEDGFIGTLPVGYSDGIPRSIANKLTVFIDGKEYQSVGNITMDYTMIYLGSEPLQNNSEVILLGLNGWDAAKWADRAETNTHEILTGITELVARSYVDMDS